MICWQDFKIYNAVFNKLGKYPYKKKEEDRIIDFEIMPADHLTKKFILNPVEGSRSAPT